MTWTTFWDMHSGGGTKEPFEIIHIEADRDEAAMIFYNRFGHSPHRVSCTCCGEDYAVETSSTLTQASGYHRKLRAATKGRETRYLEPGEVVPKGWEISPFFGHQDEQTLGFYESRSDVLIIRESEIKDDERRGELPEQGYVWVD